jgi:hypothetical protein
MGTLDDAIREHLELKRSKGASEEELGRAESEALGRGRPGADLWPEEPPDKPAEEPEVAAEEPTADHEPSMPEDVTKAAKAAEAGRSHALEELDPDEVLPEEALDPDGLPPEGRLEESLPTVPEEPPAPAVDRVGASDERQWDVGEQGAPLDEGEDVLEETPDFLEETPEHDRLWFEQKPPKDFDFGD